MVEVNYNERSWAIDLIGHIKKVITNSNRSIKDAGGEQTIRVDGGSLFPDVLLFGDRSIAKILQGWELKMPDTEITDYDFVYNAKQKAIALGLDSFLLWNVSHAHLYAKSNGCNSFELIKEWDDLSYINSRKGVIPNRTQWEKLAEKIINFVNDLFDRNSLEGRRFIDAYKSGGITALIMENSDEISDALTSASNANSRLKSEITLWWNTYKSEYDQSNSKNPNKVLAQVNISNWIGKILFAHILQGKDNRARVVTTINSETSPSEALDIFKSLSQKCNFWTIFSDSIGLSIIPKNSWNQLMQLNKLLTDLQIGSIEQSQLSGILEATVEVTIRKLRGQYPTPLTLAKLLVRLCIKNIADDRVLDPCCGSGSIVRAAMEHKLLAGIDANKVSQDIFAGDQDPQAVQITTFSLANPALMHMPLKIFKQDVFLLEPKTELEFRNPQNGQIFKEKAGTFNAITSNFPFVAQNGRKHYGNNIAKVSASLQDSVCNLPKNADISAYLPFSLHPLLAEGGRLGIIITNAWLGTAWGDAFFKLIKNYYRLKYVITSGAGRWFENANVVTNILILEKDKFFCHTKNNIAYIVLTRPLEELSDIESIDITAAQIELGQTQNETMTIRSVSHKKLEQFASYGLRGNAQFVNCDWILNLPLVKVKNLFTLERGERRGWNDLFYPQVGHNIEQEYIRPLLKSPNEVDGYITIALKEAFSCSLSIEELKQKKHFGAISWIKRFENKKNNSGVPLTSALSRNNLHWYEMQANKLTELIIPLAPNKRLFVSKLDSPSFVDQRLTCLKAKAGIDINLCHALMNSAISMFMIEGMGFGRGLGVIDLSKNRIEEFFHILDPGQLGSDGIQQIKSAFLPLCKRNILDIADELENQDRKIFDQIVVDAFALNISIDRIYDCLLRLVEIRQTVIEKFS